jgi:hypothetical protein
MNKDAFEQQDKGNKIVCVSFITEMCVKLAYQNRPDIRTSAALATYTQQIRGFAWTALAVVHIRGFETFKISTFGLNQNKNCHNMY